MILISKSEREDLERVGLLKHKRKGVNSCDSNFTVANREHLGRAKHTYITEEVDVMLFLQHYENLNLQKISETQLKSLVDGKLISDSNTQKNGEYVPNAIAFEDRFGQWRVKKITKLMIFLNIWKKSKGKN